MQLIPPLFPLDFRGARFSFSTNVNKKCHYAQKRDPGAKRDQSNPPTGESRPDIATEEKQAGIGGHPKGDNDEVEWSETKPRELLHVELNRDAMKTSCSCDLVNTPFIAI